MEIKLSVGSGGEPARYVIRHVRVKQIVELVRDRAGRGRNLVAVDFAHPDEIPIRRRDKNLIRIVKIFRAKSLFEDRHACFGSDLEKNSARDPLEAPRI